MSSQAPPSGASKKLSPRDIVEACNDLMIQGRSLEALERYISPQFIEHSPRIPNGDRDGLRQFLKDDGWLESDSPKLKQMQFYTDRVIASGEFVVTHMHVVTGPSEPVLVLMDIFRVQNGLIVEHWDVVQPEPEQPANTRYKMY